MIFADPIPRRLDKLVRDSTRLSRAEIGEAITAGRIRVAVGGVEVVAEPDRLMFGGDEVRLDGEALRPLREHHTMLLHKPAGVTATARDPLGQSDLSTWLEAMPRGSFPVGRLDRETTGALLFTTDGDLAHAVLQPHHHAPKEYRLRIAGVIPVGDPRLRHLCEGVETSLGRLAADEVRVVARSDDDSELSMTLSMGKNRQIRRMCYALGLRLLHLHRRAIGPIALEGTAAGQWRRLDEAEVERLWEAVQGRQSVRQRKWAALSRQARAARRRGEPLERLERWLRSARGACGQ